MAGPCWPPTFRLKAMARWRRGTRTNTGKTHIAISASVCPCQEGLTVGFITAAALVHELIEARDEKRLLRFQKQLAKYKLLIIDELGFVPLAKPRRGVSCCSRCSVTKAAPPWCPPIYRSMTLPAVVEAAVRSGAHEMILDLPGGYDFEVEAGGAALSGGQRQRIALARAFYGGPAVVVLDEPDAHLDAAGAEALNRAVADLKARDGAAVIVAHRPTAFAECDVVYLMENGQARPAGGSLPAPGGSPRPKKAAAADAGETTVPVRMVKGPPPGTRESGADGPVRLVKLPPPGDGSGDGGERT